MDSYLVLAIKISAYMIDYFKEIDSKTPEMVYSPLNYTTFKGELQLGNINNGNINVV